jgi:hypothetical protein
VSYHPIFEQARALGVKQIRLVIFQPKVYSGPREYTLPLGDLSVFSDDARLKAKATVGAAKMHGQMKPGEWERVYLHPDPNEEDCAFCKAQATCPATRAKLEQIVGDDFVAVAASGKPADEWVGEVLENAEVLAGDKPHEYLDYLMSSVGWLEDVCKAVRAECERRLLAGEDMPNWGLELGRQGPRKWTDGHDVEKYLRDTVRLTVEDTYNLKLKSPTQVEEMAKGDKPLIGPRQWKKLVALVTRAEPKPSVKPKAAIKTPYRAKPPSGDDFAAVSDDEDLT